MRWVLIPEKKYENARMTFKSSALLMVLMCDYQQLIA